MLDATLKVQLQQYMGMLRQPIRLIASLDDSAASQEMRGLLDDIAGVSDKISLDTSGSDARKPSFVIAREGETSGVRFAGLPLGHEFMYAPPATPVPAPGAVHALLVSSSAVWAAKPGPVAPVAKEPAGVLFKSMHRHA